MYLASKIAQIFEACDKEASEYCNNSCVLIYGVLKYKVMCQFRSFQVNVKKCPIYNITDLYGGGLQWLLNIIKYWSHLV